MARVAHRPALAGRLAPALLALAAGLGLGIAQPQGGPASGTAVGVVVLLALFTGLAKTSSA